MNTRSICLAVLSFGEHSGYDIRKMLTEGPFSSFLAASYGSIYPALSQLESEGLIAGRDETESGRPTRRVFTITDQGQVALQADLLDVPKPDEIRSEFLLYAALSPRLPRDHIEAILSERIELMRRRLGEFEALAETEGKDCGSSAWVLGYAISLTQTHIDYLLNHGDALLALADTAPAEAAE